MTSVAPINNAESIDGIFVINEWDLLGHLNARSLPYEDQTLLINKWIHDNEAHYYAAPDEHFCIVEGLDQTKAKGKSVLVVDNLS
jgi:hypothetical protein